MDVYKNGVTIFTTQANRPEILAEEYTGYSTVIDVPTWADGEYLTAGIVQTGDGYAGADLTVQVIYA